MCYNTIIDYVGRANDMANKKALDKSIKNVDFTFTISPLRVTLKWRSYNTLITQLFCR